MDQWRDKVAVVTGASSGIGEAICKDLCKESVIVIGLARRLERLHQLKASIESATPGAQFYPIVCDVTKETDIKSAFDQAIERFGVVNILVNNAGVGSNTGILSNDNERDLEKIIQTNFMAVIFCTKRAYSSMKAKNEPGYIINISSVLGHYVAEMDIGPPGLSVYPSTKYGLTALNQVIRSELRYNNDENIRISNVSPGIVKTEIADACGIPGGFPKELKALIPEDISAAVLYILSTPPRVQIQDIIIKPTGEKF